MAFDHLDRSFMLSKGLSWPSWLLFAFISFHLWIPSSLAVVQGPRLGPRASFANGVDLRILAIGDSITNGTHWSSDAGGYRSRLYKLIQNQHWSNLVSFVGAESNGAFTENHHEGHSTFMIKQIHDASWTGIYAAPNIVLLHAGTNDVDRGQPAGADDRLRNLIDFIFQRSPNAVVFVCKIIQSKTDSTNQKMAPFNDAIGNFPSSYGNKKVVVVDMNSVVPKDDLHDWLHPNDNGYQKMAQKFFDTIVAHEKDISKPGKIETPPASHTVPQACQDSPSWLRLGEIATGAKVATTDGEYKQYWGERRVIADGRCAGRYVRLLDLDGDGLKDYACVDPKTGGVTVSLNQPNSDGGSMNSWGPATVVANPKVKKDGNSVFFADINGDGKSDYIYVDPTSGAISAWINSGKGSDGTWQWNDIGRIAGGFNATINNTQMADLDGDGRDDMFHIDEATGKVTAWMNTGGDLVPDYYNIGEIADGNSFQPGNRVIMADFTGNGRANYMYIGKNGEVNGFLNRMQENSLKPRWLKVDNVAKGRSDVNSDEVRMVDMTGDGKVDYLIVNAKTGKITMQENQSVGGKYQPGDGVMLCDLDGDGAADYFWVNEDGAGWGYLNKGKGTDTWKPLGKISDSGAQFGSTTPRRLVRMAVLTDSGRADYVALDPKTGQAVWWQNTGGSSGAWFQYRGVIASGPAATLKNTFGYNFNVNNVRFADLSGDGLDDYLYVNEIGATVMWTHLSSGENSWSLPHLVADGPKMDPDGDGVTKHIIGSQVQFADVDGDGKLDYNVVGTMTGRTWTWHNLGFRDDGSIRWYIPLPFADGPGPRGSSIRLADMTGEGRADYVAVDPDSGRLDLWKNRCQALDFPTPGSNDDTCRWSMDLATSWQNSGAADFLEKYIAANGSSKWLNRADAAFNARGPSSVHCSDLLSSNDCVAGLDKQCSDWDPAAFRYVRNMASRVQSVFHNAHEELQSNSIRDLSLVDQMIVDFKTEIPDNSLLSQIFGELGAGAGLVSAIVGIANPVAGAVAGGASSMFGLLGGVVSMTNPSQTDYADDLDKVAAASKKYVGEILTAADDMLSSILLGFFGDGATKDLSDLYKHLVDANIIKQSGRKDIVSRVLDGGQFMVPPTQSDIHEALENGIKDTLGAVLGNLLAGLHYMVVEPNMRTKIACDKTPAARFVEDTCLYLVSRAKGAETSKSVDEDKITAIEKTYGVSLYEMLKNVKDCKNHKLSDAEKKEIYIGSNRYPPCYFGLAYVASPYMRWPLLSVNTSGLPEWIGKGHTDEWNDAKEAYCSLDSSKDDCECGTDDMCDH